MGATEAHAHIHMYTYISYINQFPPHIHTHPPTPIPNAVDTDAKGYITVRPGTPETSLPGVFAAGDVQDPHWRQVRGGLIGLS